MEYTYRNLRSLTKWLQRLLYLLAAFDVLSVVGNRYERSALQHAADQGIQTAQAIVVATTSTEKSLDFFNYPVAAIGLATTVLAGIWIYRAAINLRALGAKDMAISPGWAVGWYFIPIANLWKPFQAMKEIWQASLNPLQGGKSAAPRVLRIWWGLWLLGFLVPLTGTIITLHETPASQLLFSNALQLAMIPFDFSLQLVFAFLIGRIWQMQSAQPAPAPLPQTHSAVPTAG